MKYIILINGSKNDVLEKPGYIKLIKKSYYITDHFESCMEFQTKAEASEVLKNFHDFNGYIISTDVSDVMNL